MKRTITLVLITLIMILAAGCGPGQPFEIEPANSLQQHSTIQIAAIDAS